MIRILAQYPRDRAWAPQAEEMRRQQAAARLEAQIVAAEKAAAAEKAKRDKEVSLPPHVSVQHGGALDPGG